MIDAFNNFTQKYDDFKKAAEEYISSLESRILALEEEILALEEKNDSYRGSMKTVDKFMQLFQYGFVSFEFTGLIYCISVKSKEGIIESMDISMSAAIEKALKALEPPTQ